MLAVDFPSANSKKVMGGDSIRLRLERWQTVQGLGKKPTTRKFHAEIIGIVKQHLSGLERNPSELDETELIEFAQKVARYCPSRFNAIVTVLRHVTGQPKLFKYRKLRFRHFKPPTQEEFTALLIECDMAPKSHCGLIIRLLCLTGLRIAEARQLQWSHVGDDSLHLPGTITKNGLPRSVPLLPGAREILSRLRAISQNGHVLPHASMRTALKKACKRAGVPHLRPHDCRHYFATACISAGCDLPTISAWLGHSDGGALAGRLYYHLTDDHSRRMAEKVRIAI